MTHAPNGDPFVAPVRWRRGTTLRPRCSLVCGQSLVNTLSQQAPLHLMARVSLLEIQLARYVRSCGWLYWADSHECRDRQLSRIELGKMTLVRAFVAAAAWLTGCLHQLGGYKGISGAVKAVSVHPTLPFVATAGLDRCLRVHQIESRQVRPRGIVCGCHSPHRVTAVLSRVLASEADKCSVRHILHCWL